MPEPTHLVVVDIDGDTILKLRSDGLVTLLSESVHIEGVGIMPPQEMRVDALDLIKALDSARDTHKEAHGHDPFSRPEDREVHSDS